MIIFFLQTKEVTTLIMPMLITIMIEQNLWCFGVVGDRSLELSKAHALKMDWWQNIATAVPKGLMVIPDSSKTKISSRINVGSNDGDDFQVNHESNGEWYHNRHLRVSSNSPRVKTMQTETSASTISVSVLPLCPTK